MKNINDIIKNVMSQSFQNHYVDIINTTKDVILHEENDDGLSKTTPYDITVKIPSTMNEDELVLFKNLESFKNELLFLGHTKPKDSDHILVNITQKKAYIFELKNTNSCSNDEIGQQLLSGKHWLYFFLFLLNADSERNITDEISILNEWQIYLTKIKYANRPHLITRHSASRPDYFKYIESIINDLNGSSIYLAKLKSYTPGSQK